MEQNNSVKVFVLLGLTRDPVKEKLVFIIFLIFYVGTVLSNLLIIVTIKCSRTLGSPMYFFLFYLSLADFCFSTSITPRLLIDSLSTETLISYNECLTQIFVLHLFGAMDIFVLILMAADRYVAICKPLHYQTIMSRQVCIILIVVAWVGSFIHSLTQILLALRLPFCGPNLIDHYCCDLQPLLKLACMDTYAINLLFVTNSGTICSSSLVMLMISYSVILRSLRNHSAEAKRKALSTCTTHVAVVLLSLVPCIFMYVRPPVTFSFDKMVEVCYTLGIPFLNPLIYTLRNAEVKSAMKMLWSIRISSAIKR